MERRGQDRDRDIGSYNPEPPVKLPLAAIISTPTDRRGNNATLPTRRGSSIFSPTQTQTLDHHHHLLPHLHHRHNLTPPPPPHVLLVKDHSPDPDPSTPPPDGTSNSRTPPSPPQPQLHPPPPPLAEGQNNSSGCIIRYRECLKNHAASMGGHVVDGCGEFMPNGDDGTAESLRCAACDCHRNFHRKEIDGEAQPSNFHHSCNRTPLRSNRTPPLLAPAHQQGHGFSAAAAGMVHFGGGGDESSSEDLNNMYQSSGGGGGMGRAGSKKRFRTKFSQEQKDRMQELAEKMEWRIQKQDEQLVQKLCEETGVKRQVFKVWMHNNKQAMKKKHIQI